MKTQFTLFSLGLVLGLCAIARADNGNFTPEQREAWHQKHAAMHECVKRTLASEGVAMPEHQPGQKPSLTDAQKDALKAAHQSCASQISSSTADSSSSASSSAATSGAAAN